MIKVIRGEFNTDLNKSTGEYFKDILCNAVVDKINENEHPLSKETKAIHL